METIQLRTPDVELKNFMSMENGTAKNILYYRTMLSRKFTESNICKKDGKIYYSVVDLVPKKSKYSYYISKASKDGFTIDEKGKLKVWYNKSIFQIPYIVDVFSYFNFNWLSEKLYPYVTKGIFEKMVAGKITNNTEVVKAYFKAMRINASPALFIKLIESSSVAKQEFLRTAAIAKDINHYMEYVYERSKGEHQDYDRVHILHDMTQEALILDEKIDFKWSTNRLREVHKEWTEKIMEEEINTTDDKVLEYVAKFDKYTPEGFKLLKTQREVFYEGRTMKHCVYTAYWDNIKRGNYLAYHVTLGEEEATLGVSMYGGDIVYNQCYTRYNQGISTDMQVKVRAFVEELNEQVKRDGTLYFDKPNNIVETELIF